VPLPATHQPQGLFTGFANRRTRGIPGQGLGHGGFGEHRLARRDSLDPALHLFGQHRLSRHLTLLCLKSFSHDLMTGAL
jgi:hypothetical protein